MIRPMIALTLLAAAMPALAQTRSSQAQGGTPPQRIRSVTLTGNQKCPAAVGDEVVVCARIEPGQQYRIPKEVRNDGPLEEREKSFAAKTDRLDEVGRESAGLPDTCSPVGSGGHTGCNKVLLERAAADRHEGATPRPR